MERATTIVKYSQSHTDVTALEIGKKLSEDPRTTGKMGKKDGKSPDGSKEDPKGVRGSLRGSRLPAPLHPKLPITPERNERTEEKSDMQKILDKLGKLDKIDDSITAQEFAMGQLTEKIGQIKNNCDEAVEVSKQVKEETADMKAQVKIHGTRLADIEEKIEFLERERRRNILIIEGVTEKEGEAVREIVNKAFTDLQLNFDAGACATMFRRGRAPSGEKEKVNKGWPRPIVVIFHRQQDKGEVFRNLKNLKGNEDWEKIFFNDDLTETQAGEQRDLRALAAYARDLGHVSIVKAGLLYLDTRRYRYDEIHKLPEGINLLNAKTIHILEDKAVVFQSPHSPLSNMYPCNLVYRGERFLSAEGAWQFTRATVCGHKREAQLIKLERKPFKVKKIAESIRNTPEWEDQCEEVMLEILYEKFKQDKFCRETLLKTGERKLFEGTGDKRWGCGIPISKAKNITFKNPGRNLLGLQLEKVRGDIRPK